MMKKHTRRIESAGSGKDQNRKKLRKKKMMKSKVLQNKI